jgi:hypothetical protein
MKEGEAMTRSGLSPVRQLALFAALAVLALSLSGDRTTAAGVPASVYGQDPLEVLELKVRPNVIVVLDSSGSMTSTVTGTDTRSGDHPRSKLWQAKQVLNSVVQANQSKVSFQFLTYTQVGSTLGAQGAGRNRFQYSTNATNPMPSPEITVRRAQGDDAASERGLQSWQIIYPQWNTLYFEEDAATDAVCVATLNVGTGKFYATGASLAADIQAAMNAAACTGTARTNVYRVTYTTTDGKFAFTRSTANRSFRIRWDRTPNNIRNALAETSASSTSWSTGTISTDYPYTLLYRTTGTGSAGSLAWPFSSGLSTRWSFTESSVTYYQIAASRLWNGETIHVDGSGNVCNVEFANGTETNPPTLTVAADCSGGSGSVKFTFSGDQYGGNDVSCRGGLSRVPLIPCDLAMPPAATQIANVGPYIEPQLPFDGPTGVPRGYTETMDGSWSVQQAITQPSAKADGWTPIATSLMDIKGLPDGTDASTYNSSGSGGCLVQDTATNEPCTDPTTQTCVLGGCAERNFSKFWNQGQAASPGPPQAYPLDAIKDHLDPKEKTIVLFVTDGDDTCPARRDNDCRDSDGDGQCDCIDVNSNGSCDTGEPPASGPGNGDTDWTARRAAYYAERLYTPLVKGEAGSSVQTFMIGYGGAFSSGVPTRLNWIAWGGSGLGQGQPGQPDVPTDGSDCQSWGTGTLGDVTGSATPVLDGTGQTGTCAWNATAAQLTAQRARCTTCQDAFVAPDAATLATQLQAIIDQGAAEGEFNAQQSITESVFEYVNRVTLDDGTVLDAASPSGRYRGIVPTRFVSSFTLPAFQGHLRAYQAVGTALNPDPCDGTGQCQWDAGKKLTLQISAAMANTTICSYTGVVGECLMSELHGGATDATIATSTTAAIKRRIYTTTGNGVFCSGYPSSSSTCTFSPTGLMDGTSYGRIALWPPAAGLLPNDYTSPGLLDAAMGFPPNTPTSFPTNVPAGYCNSKTYDQCWLDVLQRDFKACLGSNLPSACTSTTVNTKMRAARREARQMAIAFLAGAAAVPDGAGVKRTPSTGSQKNMIVYTARSWALADSELATVGVITPPALSEPSLYQHEYALFRDGARQNGKNVDSTGSQIYQGFGLAQPDDDNTTLTGSDTRTAVKPVMTVVYAPANDMLHAFRAGPCSTPGLSTGCTETGGEELWGYVPYDQLETVRLRPGNEPQGRSNHVYSLARGVRFADVFVPGSWSRTIGGVASTGEGVWRRVLYFGRGIGGKYVTALDVTAPGPYTTAALNTRPPIPLWNRGNPDTQNGLVGGPADGPSPPAGSATYANMGETWSIPTVAYVNDGTLDDVYRTARREKIQFVVFMGSGYGNPGEGTAHYTLDAQYGDIVAAADVELVASRGGAVGYPNAIVANSVSFNVSTFQSVAQKAFNVNPHPWSNITRRVYVGDLHGHLWKFLTTDPGTPLLAADLGADQPVGTAVALLAENGSAPEGQEPPPPPGTNMIPNIFVTSGAERRASGPFRNFSLIDKGDDVTPGNQSDTTSKDGVVAYTPIEVNFARTFDEGDEQCALPEGSVFRGTVQPTSAVECSGGVSEAGVCQGDMLQRVFYGGTRLSLPNTKYAPPTPLACGTGEYPCRSQFDSILYALGVKTGQAAYDLNASTDDAYRIFRDSRIAAISFQADPDPGRGGSSFTADEGLMKGVPKPPPPPGVPPTTTSATASVIFKREPGQPTPVVQYGSTVCQ